MSAWYDVIAWSAEQWTAVGTVATAGTAVAAAWFAGVQVRQARRLREEQAQPVVVVDFEPSAGSGGFIDLVIRNTGQTLAHEVKIQFTPNLVSALDERTRRLADTALLQQGIPTLPPGREYRALYDVLSRRYDEETKRFNKDGLETIYQVAVSFTDSLGKPFTISYRLSLDIYASVTQLQRYGIHDLAKSVRELARNVDRTTRGGKLQVEAFDGDYDRWSVSWQIQNGNDEYPTLGNPQPAGRPSPHKYDYLDAKEPRSRLAVAGRPKQQAGRRLRRAQSLRK